MYDLLSPQWRLYYTGGFQGDLFDVLPDNVVMISLAEAMAICADLDEPLLACSDETMLSLTVIAPGIVAAHSALDFRRAYPG